MPQFAILIYAPTPADWTSVPDDELAAHGNFGQVLTDNGVKQVDAYALAASTNAKSIKGELVASEPAVADALTLGGFAVVEANDLEHALSVAKHNPATWRGAVEVRPLLAGPEQ